jgi:hypothetical protein
MTTPYGPGDPQTWGPPTGHPNDPRTVEAECPDCDAPLDAEGDCTDECGYAPHEPDWEAIAEARAEARGMGDDW